MFASYVRHNPGKLLLILCAAISCVPCGSLFAADDSSDDRDLLKYSSPSGMIRSPIGVTRAGRPLESFYMPDSLDFATPKTRVLIVSGLDGSQDGAIEAGSVLLWLIRHESLLDRYSFSAAPQMKPMDKLDAERNPEIQKLEVAFPSKEKAYDSQTNPEAIYLWRWIGMHAPDLVIDIRQGEKIAWEVPDSDDAQLQSLAKLLDAQPLVGKGELASALVKAAPCDTATIPALRLQVPGKDAEQWIPQLFAALDEAKFTGPSPARAEMQRRVKRTPLEVATELAGIYGQDLNVVQYIPAVALIARVRLGQLTGDENQLADVERIVAPYYSGEKKIEIKSGSDISGHLIFTELARVTEGERRQRYLELAKVAADLAFDENGKPRESMPFHSEMSDALFMGGPILAQVGELTGEKRYYEACWRHLQFMRGLDWRKDGLYGHSPIGEHAWGRGNGFPALGLAMCLAHFPVSGSDYSEMLIAQKRHFETLLRYQDPTGAWHQVIDHPESYRELTCTAMIGYALSQAANEDRYQLTSKEKETFQKAADKAWYAVNSRLGRAGGLVDVCTGTGKFPKLRDYFDRPAILGKDARGGAMAMLFAIEMAAREAQRKKVESK